MNSQVEITIRNWTKSDFPIVKYILLTTWKETYSFIRSKDILSHFENYYNDERLIEMLDDPFTKGIIALADTVPVGWMKLFENSIEKKFYVSSLYVLPKYQGMGMGKKLLDKAYTTAKEKTYNQVWLGVMKQNVKSLEWYTKLGYVFVVEEPFMMGTTEVMHLIGYKSI